MTIGSVEDEAFLQSLLLEGTNLVDNRSIQMMYHNTMYLKPIARPTKNKKKESHSTIG